MNGDLDSCSLVVGGGVVGNELPRRIRRLTVFLLHLRGEERGCLECLEWCDSFYVVVDGGGVAGRVSVLRLGVILFVRRNVFPSRFLL